MDINSQPAQNEPVQPAVQASEKTADTKRIFAIALIGLIIVAAAWFSADYWLPLFGTEEPASGPLTQENIPPQELPEEDTTAAIGGQLDDIIIDDIDALFNEIDAGLNQL